MVYLMEPDKAIVEFLHSYLTDPRARLTTATQNETGDGAVTIYALDSSDTKTITSITLDTIEQLKHSDYGINLDSSTPYVEFSSAPSDGAVIVINYKAGTGWIFPDKPRIDLTKTSYPRVSVQSISETGANMGVSDITTWDTINFQINIYNKKGVGFSTISDLDSQATFDNDLTDYLARKVKNVIKVNWREESGLRSGGLHFFGSANKFKHPFDEIHDLFVHQFDVEFQGQDIGRND